MVFAHDFHNRINTPITATNWPSVPDTHYTLIFRVQSDKKCVDGGASRARNKLRVTKLSPTRARPRTFIEIAF